MNNWLKNNQPLNFTRLLNRIIKQPCALCQASATSNDYALCEACLDTLPYTDNNCCAQCATPIPVSTNGKNNICGHCLKQPPYFDATYALMRYQFPLDKLLQHYKYNEALYLSQAFGRLMTEQLYLTNIDVIVPMPLHINRLKARGFNQSSEIAKVMSKLTNIPLDLAGCEKVKDRPPQASMAYKDRIKNMKKAFVCTKSYTDLHVAIVDDVMTTGATLNELSKMLKQAGAAHISCYVLARA